MLTVISNPCTMILILELFGRYYLDSSFFSLESDRRTVFIALTVISLVGTVLFFLIRKPDSENVLGEDESSDDQDMEVNE